MSVLKIFDSAPIEIQRKRRTPDGFLDVWGVAAKVGTMDYPEHGFSAHVPAETLRDAAPLLVGQPLTIEHPEEGVDPDNARHVTVGTVLESSFDEDSGEQRVRVRIYDADAIALVESESKAELSPGYDVSYRDATDEERDSIGADKVQIGRVYNHLALVEAGRGGPTVRLNLDSIRHHGADVKTKPKQTSDADPSVEPEKPAAADAGGEPEQLSDADMRKMYDMLKAKFEPKDAEPDPAPGLDAEGSEAETEKPAMSAADSLAQQKAWLDRHMKALDAARALDLDPKTHGSDTLAIERAVAAVLVGDKAKDAKPAELALVMDAAIASANRPTRLSDLRNPTGQTAQDAQVAEWASSPEQDFLHRRTTPVSPKRATK